MCNAQLVYIPPLEITTRNTRALAFHQHIRKSMRGGTVLQTNKHENEDIPSAVRVRKPNRRCRYAELVRA